MNRAGSRPSISRRQVFRNWWTATFGISASLLFGLFWFGWMVSEAISPGPIDFWLVWFLSIFFPISWWFFLKVSFFVNIEAKGSVLIVKNFFDKHVIPLEMISVVTWDRGVEVILDSGEKYWCFNLGSSLVGALAGYPTNRRCARGIEEHVSAARRLGAFSAGGKVNTSVHLNLMFLAVAITSSLLSVFVLDFLL